MSKTKLSNKELDDEVLLIRDENPRFYYNIKKNQTAADLAN